MNFSEHSVFSAIQYSMMKNCCANIVIAGSICSGKREIASVIARHIDAIESQNVVTVFPQENYYTELGKVQNNEFGTKNVDTQSVFDTDRYLKDVKAFFEKGFVYSKVYKDSNLRATIFDTPEVERPNFALDLKQKRVVNIFTGPHAINLLKGSEKIIPKPIFVYLNVDFEKCMRRRIARGFMIPQNFSGPNDWKKYYEFILNQNEDEVFPQKELADLVINSKD